MGADKLRSTIAVLTNYVDGESPTAAKLSIVSIQLQAATRELEKAIGDLKDQSWPYSSATSTHLTQVWGRAPNTNVDLPGAVERPLNIANLARLIGPASNLNPKFLSGIQTIVESVPTRVHEFTLKYPPDAASISFSATYTTEVTLTTVNGAAEYGVDYSSGRIFVATVTPSGRTVTYTTTPELWGSMGNYQDAGFNVIPDPNQVQTGLYALTVTGPVSSEYTINLPLCSAQQSNVAMTSTVLGTSDTNTGKQLTLPKVLTDNFTVDDLLPEGFLVLRNKTTNQVYSSGTYKYVDEKTIKLLGISLGTAVTDGNEFELITIGTDITTSIDDLRNKAYRHTHDRSMGESAISVNDLVDNYRVTASTGAYAPSQMPANPFSQYLHRDGWAGGVDDSGSSSINDANAMRGSVLLGLYAGTPGNYVSAKGLSHSVMFGDNLTRMYRDANNNLVARCKNMVTNGLSLYAGLLGPLVSVPSFGTDVTVDAQIRPIFPYAWSGTVTIDGSGTPTVLDFTTELAAIQAITGGTVRVADVRILMGEISLNSAYYPPGQDSASLPNVEYNYAWDYANSTLDIYWIGAGFHNKSPKLRVTMWCYAE